MNNPRTVGLGMLTLDPSRIGEALARPGMDPRTWTTLAIVTDVHVSAAGVYVDITTITGIEETATVPTVYGGPGFGFFCPLAVGDCVLVAVPEGDWNTGARVIAQVWDPGTPPPQEAIDNPRDVALVIEDGQSLRIVVSGGDAVIEVRDGAKVKLGNESASNAVLLTETFLTALGQLVAAIGTAVGGIPGGGAAGTAIASALTAFQNAAATYKSTLVDVA